jgi:hypothetical protein
MKRYNIYSDRLSRLEEEERNAPLSVANGFFQEFDLKFCQDFCGFALECLLCMKDEDLGVEFTRTEILLFFDQIERLIEASYILQEQHKNKRP